MNRAPGETLSTADLAAAGDTRTARREDNRGDGQDFKESIQKEVPRPGTHERLAPLFLPDAAKDFRARWDAVQLSFVDDPKRAVKEGDELVAHVMKSLAETFSEERANLEKQLGETDHASTENLRIALRRYRAFFDRLLSL